MLLKENNDDCKDIAINCNALHSLPINSSIYDFLQSYDDSDDLDSNAANAEIINSFANHGSLELGPAPSATGPYPNEENAHVMESFTYVNPSHSDELNENKN